MRVFHYAFEWKDVERIGLRKKIEDLKSRLQCLNKSITRFVFGTRCSPPECEWPLRCLCSNREGLLAAALPSSNFPFCVLGLACAGTLMSS